MKTTDLPDFFKLLTNSKTSAASVKAIAVVGSSKITNLDSNKIALEIATPWRSPPDNLLTDDNGVQTFEV